MLSLTGNGNINMFELLCKKFFKLFVRNLFHHPEMLKLPGKFINFYLLNFVRSSVSPDSEKMITKKSIPNVSGINLKIDLKNSVEPDNLSVLY